MLSYPKKYNYFNSFYVLVLLVGYVIISFVPGLVGTSTRVFTIPYRGFVLLLAAIIIFRGFVYDRKVFKSNVFWVFLVIFWLIYITRIFVDLFIHRINSTVFDNSGDYLLNAIGICFIPCVALQFTYKVDFDWVLKWFFLLLLICLSFSLFQNLNLEQGDSQYSGKYKGNAGLNVIAYGHLGITMSLISLFRFSFEKSTLKKLVFAGTFILGLFVMYLAGSRSPLLALLVATLFYFSNNKGILKALIFVFVLILPLYFFPEIIITLGETFQGSFFERVMSTIHEGNTSGRDLLYRQALLEFSNSPFFGNAFLIQGGAAYGIGFYPHNILIESLMATGIIGSFFFFSWLFVTLKMSRRLFKSDKGWIGLIFVQYFIYGLFSLAIFTNSYFWYSSCIVWCLYYSKNH